MQTVGIKELKNKLSAYVRAAEAGETVLVTDRGKVVAQLTPAQAYPEPTTDEERMAQLVREGRVTPAKGRWKRPPNGMHLMSFEEIMRGLDADREDR
jgi:prevent-host-death family protein